MTPKPLELSLFWQDLCIFIVHCISKLHEKNALVNIC